MKPTATKTTAFLTGIWTGFGLLLYTVTEQTYPHQETLLRAVWAVVTVFFFFAPVYLFVAGRQHFVRERSYWWRLRHPHHRELKAERRRWWADYGNACLRMVCWFSGAALSWPCLRSFSGFALADNSPSTLTPLRIS